MADPGLCERGVKEGVGGAQWSASCVYYATQLQKGKDKTRRMRMADGKMRM